MVLFILIAIGLALLATEYYNRRGTRGIVRRYHDEMIAKEWLVVVGLVVFLVYTFLV